MVDEVIYEVIEAHPKLLELIDEEQILQVIVIPGKLINFVLE